MKSLENRHVSPWPFHHQIIRKIIGFLLAFSGLCILSTHTWQYIANDRLVLGALGAGLFTALATALGTLPVLFAHSISMKTQDTMFGFGAGVMLAASAFSLILPGMEAAQFQGLSKLLASSAMSIAIMFGAIALLIMERMLPHEHFIKGAEGKQLGQLQRTWLFFFAIALHNIPEGLAVGVAYAGQANFGAGGVTAGIALQNVAEGLIVAVAFFAVGYRRTTAVLLAILSGLVEPIGAVVGASVVSYSAALLPWGLGFAAGAMLFVISHEVIPESHRHGHEVWATGGLMIGFVLMLMLSTAMS